MTGLTVASSQRLLLLRGDMRRRRRSAKHAHGTEKKATPRWRPSLHRLQQGDRQGCRPRLPSGGAARCQAGWRANLTILLTSARTQRPLSPTTPFLFKITGGGGEGGSKRQQP
jgi:hypothetical protein